MAATLALHWLASVRTLAHLPDPDVAYDPSAPDYELEEIDLEDPDLDWSDTEEADADLEEMQEQ